MDPLQRLAENNLKGLNVKKTEGNFRYFLLSAIFLLLYAGASYLYFTYEESILGFEFWGPSKQVWLIVVASKQQSSLNLSPQRERHLMAHLQPFVAQLIALKHPLTH